MPPDPESTLPLLWRHVVEPPEESAPRRGRPPKVSVDDLLDAAIELADRDGLGALTMRALAERLGVGAMSLYTYVATRDDLILLMVDQAVGQTGLPPMPDDLRGRLTLLAEVERAEHRARPWLLDVPRPWRGPNVEHRSEWQLSVVEDIDLDDVEKEQVVTLVAGFAADPRGDFEFGLARILDGVEAYVGPPPPPGEPVEEEAVEVPEKVGRWGRWISR